MRLAGQGQGGADLLLEIKIAPHARFAVDNRDVKTTVPIAPWEAALGAKITIPTLGGQVEMSIPAGTQTGRTLRLKGRGLPGNPGGDQLVRLEIRNPPVDEEAGRRGFELLKGMYEGYDPRA